MIHELVESWKDKLLEDKDLDKLWDFFDLYIAEPSQIIIEIKKEWLPYFSVFRIIVSPSKIDFEQTENILAPFLCLEKNNKKGEYVRFDNLNTIEDIIYKIEDFCSILPKIKKEVKKID